MINFEEIERWFDSDKWDMGYLTKEQLDICSYSPIKFASQTHGWKFVNESHFQWNGICNGIVLIRHSITSLDYGLYNEATEILTHYGLKEQIDFGHVYTNFKEAVILSGRGVRARNSLVYNYKFGFDSKVCVVGFMEMIQHPIKVKRVAGNNFKEKYWNNCIGCDACRKACPAGAIHNTSEHEDLYWLDSAACDDFIGFANHPRIPSVKEWWHKNVAPEIPKEIIDDITSGQKNKEMGNDNGPLLVFGELQGVPHCRECQVQAPCSKWGGNYPYEKERNLNKEKLEKKD